MVGRAFVRPERAEQPARHAKEPCAGQVGLERLSAHDGASQDCARPDEAQAGGARDAEPRRRLRRYSARGGAVGCGGGGGSARGVELHRGFLSCRSEVRRPRPAELSSNCSDFVTASAGPGDQKPSLTGFSGTTQPTRGNSCRHVGEIWLSRERRVSGASFGPRGRRISGLAERAAIQRAGAGHRDQRDPHVAVAGRGNDLGTLVLSWRGRSWGDRIACIGCAAPKPHGAHAPLSPQPGPCQ